MSLMGSRPARSRFLTVAETAAAASSNRFEHTAGSPSSFSAYEIARGAISCAIDNTAGSIGLPKGSTELSKNGGLGFDSRFEGTGTLLRN